MGLLILRWLLLWQGAEDGLFEVDLKKKLQCYFFNVKKSLNKVGFKRGIAFHELNIFETIENYLARMADSWGWWTGAR